MGRAMLSKSLIQFFVEGQGCVPSLLFDLRPNHGGGNEHNGDLFQKVLSRECMFLGSLSCHNKDLERRTLKPSAQFSGLGQTVLELLGKSVLQLYFI